MDMATGKNRVIIFIDVIAKKNILQLQAIEKFGLKSYCFINKKSAVERNEKYVICRLKKNFFLRSLQIFYFFIKNRKKIHHIEVYPGGRFTFFYMIFAKLFFLKSICCERGDLLHINDNKYSTLTKFSMKLCYKMANIVWYREFYMLAILDAMKIKNKLFFHNSVDIPILNGEKKTVDFLWVNRIIHERRADWFVDAISESILLKQNAKGVLIGFLKEVSYSIEVLQQDLLNKKPENIDYIDYSDPVLWYKQSRFFVLPSTVVFANHSLLEAMSYGVVPIISNVSGAELIVENDVSGFIFDHDKKSFLLALEKAFLLSNEEYEKMSQKARQKIIEDFSVEVYEKNLKELYEKVS